MRILILEPSSEYNGNNGGWAGYDGEYRDPIPGTTEKSTADEAREAAVAAWGESWENAIVEQFDGSITN